MTISVAMCTYNGAKYIEEQLRSILNQTHPVDEIVICDDGSSDETMSIINRIKEETAFPIRTYVNHPNLGVCANFDKAIKLCDGDIIFLSDQDDVWMSNKVDRVVTWFCDNPGKEVVFSNASFIDSEGIEYASGKTLFQAVGMTTKAEKYLKNGFGLELFLKNNRATGATMAIRKTIIPSLRIDYSATSKNGKPLHDELIALSAIERDSIGSLPDTLIQYRIHNGQDCGMGNWIKSPLQTDNALSPDCDNYKLSSYSSLDYRQRCDFLKRRTDRANSRLLFMGFFGILKDLPDYSRYYRQCGFLCLIRDIVVLLKRACFKHNGLC